MAEDASAAEPGAGIGAVILAAGSGTRLGGRPKCLLELNGESLIRRQIGALQSLGLSGIVVVLGHHHKMIDEELRQLDVDCVKQPASQHSQASSIRLGIAGLPGSLSGYLVCPSDLPLLAREDYAAVIQVFRSRSPEQAFIGPEVDGTPGHPVIFDERLRDPLEAGSTALGSGHWRSEADTGMLRWQTSNINFIFDIDTEDDIDTLEQLTGHRLAWPKA